MSDQRTEATLTLDQGFLHILTPLQLLFLGTRETGPPYLQRPQLLTLWQETILTSGTLRGSPRAPAIRWLNTLPTSKVPVSRLATPPPPQGRRRPASDLRVMSYFAGIHHPRDSGPTRSGPGRLWGRVHLTEGGPMGSRGAWRAGSSARRSKGSGSRALPDARRLSHAPASDTDTRVKTSQGKPPPEPASPRPFTWATPPPPTPSPGPPSSSHQPLPPPPPRLLGETQGGIGLYRRVSSFFCSTVLHPPLQWFHNYLESKPNFYLFLVLKNM